MIINITLCRESLLSMLLLLNLFFNEFINLSVLINSLHLKKDNSVILRGKQEMFPIGYVYIIIIDHRI